MPTPQACERDATPICHSFLADALGAHFRLVDALEEWYEWLGDEEERNNPHEFVTHKMTNADKVVLHKLISDTIKRRQPNGAWKNIDEDIIPTADELWDMLDTNRFYSFKAKVDVLRGRIEDRALELIKIVDSDQFLVEFEQLPYDDQLEYMAELIDGLPLTEVGMTYLVQVFGKPDTSPLPVFHPTRLIAPVGNFFSDNFPIMSQAGRVYVTAWLQLAPPLMAQKTAAEFAELVRVVVGRYYDPAQTFVVTGTDLDELLKRIRDFEAHNNSIYIRELYGARVAASLGILIEFVNVYLVFDTLRKNPNERNTFGLMQALASAASALDSAQKVLNLHSAFKLSRGATIGLNLVGGLYDVIINAVDGYEAWRTNDLSVAVGHGLQAVGLATAAGVAIAGAISAGEAGAMGGPYLAAGAAVLTFCGILLVQLTQDAPIERWFENNYFGINNNNLLVPEAVGDVRFRWKENDGSQNLARQISEFISMLYPLRLKLLTSTSHLTFQIEPTLAYHESEIFVFRVEEIPGVGSYTTGLYNAPLNDQTEPPQKTRHVPLNPTESQHLEKWERRFTWDEVWAFRNPSPPVSLEKTWFEVVVTIPDKFQPAFSHTVLAKPDLIDKFSFVLRARAKLPIDE